MDHLLPLLRREQRLLLDVDADADDQPVEEPARPLHHVQMAEGDRVEGAGIDGDAGRKLGIGHGGSVAMDVERERVTACSARINTSLDAVKPSHRQRIMAAARWKFSGRACLPWPWHLPPIAPRPPCRPAQRGHGGVVEIGHCLATASDGGKGPNPCPLVAGSTKSYLEGAWGW